MACVTYEGLSKEGRNAMQNKLQPLDISRMTLEDVDSVSNDVLRNALESVRRRQGTDAELLNHNSHHSHHNHMRADEEIDVLVK